MHTTEQLNTALAGRYAIDHLVGEGGMATVYLARDVRHDRRVALKVLKPDLGAIVGVERFLAEIRVTANLQHPNLLPLFDSGTADSLLFYVMPFVEGESLRARLDREKQLPIDDAIRIATADARIRRYLRLRTSRVLPAARHGLLRAVRDYGDSGRNASSRESGCSTPCRSTATSERRGTALPARALDSNLADAHVAYGLAHFRSWKWAPAEREFRRAITMNSNLPAAHRFYSQLLRITRRPDEAIREARTAEALEPLSLAAKSDLAAALFDAHRFDDAIETWKDVLELDPTYTLAAYSLGLGFGIEGRTAELNATAQRAMKLAVGGEYELNAMFLFAVEYAELGRPKQADSVIALMQTRFPAAARLPGLAAIVMVRENRLEDAMEWLELGFQQRDFAIANATCEPWFDPLRKDPRFRHLRAKLGLPD